MDLSQPYADVCVGVRGRVLAALVQLHSTPVTVRELSDRARCSPQGALNNVHELHEAGLVRVERSRNALLVQLNRDHIAVAPVIALVGLRLELVERLRDDLAGWDGLLEAGWLFGSAARGDGTRESDIDLVLVTRSLGRDSWDDRTDGLRDSVLQWTGNEAQLVEYDTVTFAELVAGHDPLVRELLSEGVALTTDARQLLMSRP